MLVYVLVDSYEYEGCSPPLKVFSTLAAAKAGVPNAEWQEVNDEWDGHHWWHVGSRSSVPTIYERELIGATKMRDFICPTCKVHRPYEMHLDWCAYDGPDTDVSYLGGHFTDMEDNDELD